LATKFEKGLTVRSSVKEHFVPEVYYLSAADY